MAPAWRSILDGRVRASIGDADLVVYPRSCLKPMQAHAMIGAGLELDDDAARRGVREPRRIPDAPRRRPIDPRSLRPRRVRPREHPGAPVRRCRSRRCSQSPASNRRRSSRTARASTPRCSPPAGSTAGRSTTTSIRVIRCRWRSPQASSPSAQSCDHIGIDGCGAPTHALSLRDLAAAFAGTGGARLVDRPGDDGAPRAGRWPDTRRHAVDAGGSDARRQGGRRRGDGCWARPTVERSRSRSPTAATCAGRPSSPRRYAPPASTSTTHGTDHRRHGWPCQCSVTADGSASIDHWSGRDAVPDTRSRRVHLRGARSRSHRSFGE